MTNEVVKKVIADQAFVLLAKQTALTMPDGERLPAVAFRTGDDVLEIFVDDTGYRIEVKEIVGRLPQV